MGSSMQYEQIDVEKEIKEFPLEPLFSRVYVKEYEATMFGGLYIPESVRDGTVQSNAGVILAVGDEVDVVKPRQIVYYGRHSGAWIRLNKEKYRVMNEEDLLGILKEGVFKEVAGGDANGR